MKQRFMESWKNRNLWLCALIHIHCHWDEPSKLGYLFWESCTWQIFEIMCRFEGEDQQIKIIYFNVDWKGWCRNMTQCPKYILYEFWFIHLFCNRLFIVILYILWFFTLLNRNNLVPAHICIDFILRYLMRTWGLIA
jgi:hypothetical protein